MKIGDIVEIKSFKSESTFVGEILCIQSNKIEIHNYVSCCDNVINMQNIKSIAVVDEVKDEEEE